MLSPSPAGPFDAVRVVSDGMDMSGFDCGNPDFNDYVTNEALRDLHQDFSVTYIGVIGGYPAAFMTLVAGAYNARNIFEDGKTPYKYRQVPAVKIARIATDLKYQGRGLGSYLIDYATAVALEVKKFIGCTLVITDALPEKISWYQRRGFIMSMDAQRTDPGRESYPMHAFLP